VDSADFLLNRVRTTRKQALAPTATPKAPPPTATPMPPAEPPVTAATAPVGGYSTTQFQYKYTEPSQDELQTQFLQDFSPTFIKDHGLNVKNDQDMNCTAYMWLVKRLVNDYHSQVVKYDPAAAQAAVEGHPVVRYPESPEHPGPVPVPGEEPLAGPLYANPADPDHPRDYLPFDPIAAMDAAINEFFEGKDPHEACIALQTQEQASKLADHIISDKLLQVDFPTPQKGLRADFSDALRRIGDKVSGWKPLGLPVGPALGAYGNQITEDIETYVDALGLPQRGAIAATEKLPTGMPGYTDIHGLLLDFSNFWLDPAMVAMTAAIPLTGGTSASGMLMFTGKMAAAGIAADEIVRQSNRYLGTDISPMVGMLAGSLLPSAVDVALLLRRGVAAEAGFIPVAKGGTNQMLEEAIGSGKLPLSESSIGTFPGVHVTRDVDEAASYSRISADVLAAETGAPVGRGIVTGSVAKDLRLATEEDVNALRVQLRNRGLVTGDSAEDMTTLTTHLEEAGFQGAITGKDTMVIFDQANLRLHTAIDITGSLAPMPGGSIANFANEAALAKKVQGRGWGVVSATTEGMSPADQLIANTRLAKDLTGKGFHATVTDGYWVNEAGVLTKEKSVLVTDLSSGDAYTIGKISGQTSVLIPDGELLMEPVAGKIMIHPIRGPARVGKDLPVAAGGTEVRLGDGTVTRFAVDIDRGSLVPWRGRAELPTEAVDRTLGPLAPRVATAEAQADLAFSTGSWQLTSWDWTTKYFPGLKKFQIPFNPYASGTEPLARPIIGYNRYIESANAAATLRMNALANIGPGRLVNREKQLTIAVRSDLPEEIQALARVRAPADIMQYGPKWYVLTPDEIYFRETANKAFKEILADLDDIGFAVNELKFAEGEMYFPRVHEGQYGVEKARRPSTGATRPLLKPGLLRERFNETQAEFLMDGGIAADEVMGVMSASFRTLYKLGADHQMIAMVEKLGVPMKSLIPAELTEDVQAAAARERQLRGVRNALNKQIGRPGSKVPIHLARGPLGEEMPKALRDDLEAIKAIVTKYTKMSKKGTLTATNVKDMNRELTVIRNSMNERLTVLHELSTTAKSEVTNRMDMIRNAMATYQRTPTAAELDAGLLDVTVGPPTVPFDVLMKRAHPGMVDFPEGAIAIGKLGGDRWPMFQNYLFPSDITEALEKVYQTGVNEWITKGRKVVDMGRALEAGFDLNFPFIQGVTLAGRNPAAWAKAAKISYATVANPGIARSYLVKQAQLYPEAWESFVNDVRQIGESEFFLSTRGEGYLSKVPILRHAAGRMGEAFDQFLDIGKWEWYKSMYPTVFQRYGKAGTQELAATIRNALGTTSTLGLGIPGKQRALETFLLFAPRYTRSVFALLSDAVSGGIRGTEARRALGGLAASASLVYTAVAHALGQEPQFDPSAPDFLSVRAGDNYLGLPGILRAVMSTTARSLVAAGTDPSVFYDPRRFLDDPAVRFFRSRSAAGVSDLIDIAIGKDYIGQPTRSSWQDVARLFQGFISPFGVGSWQEVHGDLATHFSVSIGAFLLGRTTPISPTQLRNEHVYAWASGMGHQLTDLQGQKFTPDSYSMLPRYLKEEFDTFSPNDTKRVLAWHEHNDSPLVEVDQARTLAFQKIAQAGFAMNNQNDPAYGDHQVYQARVAQTLGDEATAISAYYTAHPYDAAAITREQQTILDYNEKVLIASKDEYGNIDWNLQNVLERQFFSDTPDPTSPRFVGDEARMTVFKQYTSSMDPQDGERREVNWFLQDTYYAYMDSLWSTDGMAAFIDPAGKWADYALPVLADGRSPLNFGSATEYQKALDKELFTQFRASGIPDDLRNFPSGGKDSKTLGELYGVNQPLGDAQAHQAGVDVRSALMKDWWAFNDAVSIDYLGQPQNAEVLKQMRIWKKTDLPAALEEALAGITTKVTPVPAPTSGAAGLFR